MRDDAIALLEILENGLTVMLSNGGKFRVDPYDRYEASTWAIADDIEIDRTRDDVYNYTLLNINTDAWIRATKLN
ncbi:hypothetical protein ACFL6U_09050 [Planctomycetota bacterium]